MLLAKNPNLNIQNNEENTALIVAVYKNNNRNSKILLAYNPDLNIQNNDGHTALAIAQPYGYQDIVEILQRHQKDN